MVKPRRHLQGLRGLHGLGAPRARDYLGYLEGREALGDQRRLGIQGCLGSQVTLILLPPQQALDTQ